MLRCLTLLLILLASIAGARAQTSAPSPSTLCRAAIAAAEREYGLPAGLLAVPGLTLHGPRDGSNRLSVFALNLAGWDNGTLALELSDRYGIESRPGLHCSPLAHRTLGTFPQGALRLSPGYFNTPEEMDRTVRALEELAREGR